MHLKDCDLLLRCELFPVVNLSVYSFASLSVSVRVSLHKSSAVCFLWLFLCTSFYLCLSFHLLLHVLSLFLSILSIAFCISSPPSLSFPCPFWSCSLPVSVFASVVLVRFLFIHFDFIECYTQIEILMLFDWFFTYFSQCIERLIMICSSRLRIYTAIDIAYSDFISRAFG